MRRRQFIALGAAAVGWPLAGFAQQAGKAPTIGFLGAASASVGGSWLDTFTRRLRELGWTKDGNLALEVRWADGRADRAAEIAAEFTRLKVDVIVTWATAPALAAKQTTSAIPIVFALATDPVGVGLVASLARPGGNATGLSAQNIHLAGERLELLRDTVPNLSRLAIMANAGISDTATEMREVQATAHRLGMEVATLELRRAEDIAPAFETIKAGGRPEALFVVGDPLTYTNRMQIIALALDMHLPTTYAIREFVAAGGLMSYGANFPGLFRRAAEFADKILRGGKPGDIPVEQPTKFDLVINLRTAKALNLDLPTRLLALADEVIE